MTEVLYDGSAGKEDGHRGLSWRFDCVLHRELWNLLKPDQRSSGSARVARDGAGSRDLDTGHRPACALQCPHKYLQDDLVTPEGVVGIRLRLSIDDGEDRCDDERDYATKGQEYARAKHEACRRTNRRPEEIADIQALVPWVIDNQAVVPRHICPESPNANDGVYRKFPIRHVPRSQDMGLDQIAAAEIDEGNGEAHLDIGVEVR